MLVRPLFACLVQRDEVFFFCWWCWWLSLSLLLRWRWWGYYERTLGFSLDACFLASSSYITSRPPWHAIRLIDPLAKQAGVGNLILQHWGRYHAATTIARMMLLVVMTSTTGGVNWAGFAAGLEAGAGREPGHKDDGAIGTEQVGQAWVKRRMGKSNVADANELPGEDPGVGGVSG